MLNCPKRQEQNASLKPPQFPSYASYALWVSFLTFYHVINCKVVNQDKPNKKPTILGWFIQPMGGDFGDGLLILGFTTLLCLVYEAA